MEDLEREMVDWRVAEYHVFD